MPAPVSFLGERLALPVFAVVCIGLLGGASCKKDSASAGDPKDVIAAADNAKKVDVVVKADRTPLSGVDVSGLDEAKQTRFFELVAALPSPCGKGHSLRASVTSDSSCKRAPFAGQLVAELIADDQSDELVQEIYADRYLKNTKVHTFQLDGAPSHGPADAVVTLVEFFDYGCPACLEMKSTIQQVERESQGKLRVVYKMYPLPAHPDSFGAAQAALVALGQGKFDAMHDILFANIRAHKKEDLRKYAEQIGLDMAKYDAEFPTMEPTVKASMAEGEAAGIDGTPSLFLNGRKYPGPNVIKYVKMAISEEIAARR